METAKALENWTVETAFIHDMAIEECVGMSLQCCKYFAAQDNMVSQYVWLETDFETISEPKDMREMMCLLFAP